MYLSASNLEDSGYPNIYCTNHLTIPALDAADDFENMVEKLLKICTMEVVYWKTVMMKANWQNENIIA